MAQMRGRLGLSVAGRDLGGISRRAPPIPPPPPGELSVGQSSPWQPLLWRHRGAWGLTWLRTLHPTAPPFSSCSPLAFCLAAADPQDCAPAAHGQGFPGGTKLPRGQMLGKIVRLESPHSWPRNVNGAHTLDDAVPSLPQPPLASWRCLTASLDRPVPVTSSEPYSQLDP